VWPRGKTWKGKENKNRNPPQWYYACLLDFIQRNSGKENVRFVLHVHEAIRSMLPTAPIYESCKSPSTLSIEYCDIHLPPMWPNVKRFEPLIDSIVNELVIVADIHDIPELQTKTIEHYVSLVTNSHRQWTDQLLTTLNDGDDDMDLIQPNGMILTFWPTDDENYLVESFHDDVRLGPKPTLEAVHGKRQNKWIIDGGLALSNLYARCAIRESHRNVTFAEHIKECSRIYNWDSDELRGTDEALLQLYLLSFRTKDIPYEKEEEKLIMEHVVRQTAKPFVHNLSRRTTNPPKHDVFVPVNYVPNYIYQDNESRKRFVYDGEGKFNHRGQYIELQWKEQRVLGVRSSKRKRDR
jgi:hypothetical protein